MILLRVVTLIFHVQIVYTNTNNRQDNSNIRYNIRQPIIFAIVIALSIILNGVFWKYNYNDVFVLCVIPHVKFLNLALMIRRRSISEYSI